MGRDSIVRLVVRSKDKTFYSPWLTKKRPTTANLAKWRDDFNQSLQKGEINEHLGNKYWIQTNLEIYNQITGQVICEYTSPAFEVIP